jgi:hypothetical protein
MVLRSLGTVVSRRLRAMAVRALICRLNSSKQRRLDRAERSPACKGCNQSRGVSQGQGLQRRKRRRLRHSKPSTGTGNLAQGIWRDRCRRCESHGRQRGRGGIIAYSASTTDEANAALSSGLCGLHGQSKAGALEDLFQARRGLPSPAPASASTALPPRRAVWWFSRVRSLARPDPTASHRFYGHGRLADLLNCRHGCLPLR